MSAVASPVFGGERIRRKVKLYRNGDSVTHPAVYRYDSARITSFTNLLTHIQNMPLFDDGYTRITRLYTIDGRRIIDQAAFETSDMSDFVATGPEGFLRIKGGYQNHVGYRTPTEEDHPQDPHHTSTPNQLQYQEENTQRRPVFRRSNSNRPIRPQPMSKEATYDRLSYLDLNKQRYGMLPRLHGDRIENRVDIGTVKRIYLYRNGDPLFKPKLYVYRSKLHKTWEKFLEDLEGMAPPVRGGGVRNLYTLRGKAITSFDQLSDKKGYVVAGGDGYLEVKGGYELIGRVEHRTTTAIPEVISRPLTQQSGRPKTGFGRIPGERLLDRRLPEPTFFFVFKNGDGLEAKRFLFTPQQMDKGMSWLMEQVGRRFGIYAHRLVTMDNREIADSRQFINRGAYIVIPFGEKFTENWHHFPEMAIDTSVFSRREGVNRSHSRFSHRPPTGRFRSQSRSQSRLPSRSRSTVSRSGLQSARYNTTYDEEQYAKQLLHHDVHHNEGRRESAGSPCEFCDLLERHRLKNRRYSVDDVQNKTLVSKSQSLSPDNPALDYARQPHMYSAEDVDTILPPRPVTSRRFRLSPHGMFDDNTYPFRSASLDIMPRPVIDDHGPVIASRKASVNIQNLSRQLSNLDHVHDTTAGSTPGTTSPAEPSASRQNSIPPHQRSPTQPRQRVNVDSGFDEQSQKTNADNTDADISVS